ncbi:MAG: Glycosyl transferase family 2 [Candidatus Methanohalarchaeum thermophilum]|uniref:Glycosyl transferase family 2 n=1 Tax=Methanohalarchaeum thermophilum TaxID=1903181 RepID=A0A1Q6DU80_METT1|nr:MAG: Glycosyl transferase family 2 [Candidatus Methanohalarchaeum thermophilum]
MKISVVIPTLNEEKGIKKTLNKLKPIKKEYDAEFLVIDGGSSDRTREIAREKGAKVIVEERKGYGRAYKTGFSKSKGDIIVTMDGDDSYPAENTLDLIEYFQENGIDFLTTNRFGEIKEGAMTPKHKLGNAILTKVMKLLFNINIKDSQSGMWIFKKSLLKELDLKSNGMPFSEEIKIEAFNNTEIKSIEKPIRYREREGQAKINSWKDGLENLIYLFKKRFT